MKINFSTELTVGFSLVDTLHNARYGIKVKIINLALFSWTYFSLEHNFNVIVMQIRPTSVVNNLLNSFWRRYTATDVSIIFFSWQSSQAFQIHQRFEDPLRLRHHGYDVTYSIPTLPKLYGYSHRVASHTILCFRAEIGLRNSRLTETSDQALIPREIYCIVTVEASV